MAQFDPYQAGPDFQAQRDALSRMYNQGIINLNARKGNLMSQYGFKNGANFGTDGKGVDFSNLQVDPNQQFGAYRNELTSEANMLDAAQNGPDRGFSGGLANQASRFAQQAVKGRQTAFQQSLQQQLGNMNMDAGNQYFNFDESWRGVGQSETEYQGGQALWQGTNATAPPPPPVVVPGASGGGTTPLTPQAISNAAAYGYQVVNNPSNLRPMTFGPKPVVGGRGHVT